jgi:excisionase family DNA binding protein
MTASSQAHWLKMGEATDLLGVSTATLRRWADAGHIHAFTTPGGHRRFDQADVLAMLPRAGRRAPRPRERSTEGPGTQSRHKRALLRVEGRRMIELIQLALDSEGRDQQRALERATAIAAGWGRVPGAAELSTHDAVEVLHRLREPFLRRVAGDACRRGLSPARTGKRLIAASAAMDRLLDTCIASHEAARSARDVRGPR